MRTSSISDCPISHAGQLANPFFGLPLVAGKCEVFMTEERGKKRRREELVASNFDSEEEQKQVLSSSTSDQISWVDKINTMSTYSGKRKRSEEDGVYSILASKGDQVGTYLSSLSRDKKISDETTYKAAYLYKRLLNSNHEIVVSVFLNASSQEEQVQIIMKDLLHCKRLVQEVDEDI